MRPPPPPPESNLRITDWFGAPIPFGQSARYVCDRGLLFEDDPAQEEVLYECQVSIMMSDLNKSRRS